MLWIPRLDAPIRRLKTSTWYRAKPAATRRSSACPRVGQVEVVLPARSSPRVISWVIASTRHFRNGAFVHDETHRVLDGDLHDAGIPLDPGEVIESIPLGTNPIESQSTRFGRYPRRTKERPAATVRTTRHRTCPGESPARRSLRGARSVDSSPLTLRSGLHTPSGSPRMPRRCPPQASCRGGLRGEIRVPVFRDGARMRHRSQTIPSWSTAPAGISSVAFRRTIFFARLCGWTG